MGNRAVITASTDRTTGVGIYVHWNGGYESVQAFLDVCRDRGYRDPTMDESYAMARLCGLICEFFGGAESVGIGPLRDLDCDNYDNGVYVIGENWTVIDRWGEGSTPIPKSMTRIGSANLKKYNDIKDKLKGEATCQEQ
jgi:hypothetical protein